MILNDNTFFKSVFIACVCVASACTPLRYTPITTFDSVQTKKEKAIESHIIHGLKQNNSDSTLYESLAFGQMIVYKPQAFETLDSLFDIKYTYSEQQRDRELLEMNIDQQIEQQRQIAAQHQHEMRYEIEHIYAISNGLQRKINCSYFYMDHQDSLLNIYNRYTLNISRRYYDLYKHYLFEMHFVTDRDMYISRPEQDFIQLFKRKENELIGTTEHQEFIQHTLGIMEIARQISTIDYVQLSKAIVIILLESQVDKVKISTFQPLVALENAQKELLGYELSLDWKNEKDSNGISYRTTVEFDPYLRIQTINDQITP